MAASEFRSCKGCGDSFTHAGRGRPRLYCEACRAGRRTDDAAWRTVRAQVLVEEPVCAVRGCGRPSTTVDHIVPLIRGGSRIDRANLQGMCGPHNFAKGAKAAAQRLAGSPSSERRCFGEPCPPYCDGTRGWWHL